MNVVIDTNVLISGLINSKGIPGQIVNLILNENLTLLYDNRIIEEYDNVLNREKFNFNKNITEPLIDFIKNEGIYIVSTPLNINFADESDKMFLEVAISGNAEYLVTGNTAHFPEEKFILTPRYFLDKIINKI